MFEKLNPSAMSRYQIPKVIDHLASNYVMGTLNIRVRKRIDSMRVCVEYKRLDERILYWENQLSPLDSQTPELQPMPETWQNIQAQIGMAADTSTPIFKGKLFDWSSLSLHRWVTAFSLMLVVALGAISLQPAEEAGVLSYIAVLADDNQTPQVVATAYSKSRELVLDVLALPEIAGDKTFELWATSKTDGQIRSLGKVTLSKASLNRTLTKAEWGLIKDSASLMISVEAQGGSMTGKPSAKIVSSGPCIRLEAWKAG